MLPTYSWVWDHVMDSFNYQLDTPRITWEESCREELSALSWFVGMSWGGYLN